jgi:hypothetical protein
MPCHEKHPIQDLFLEGFSYVLQIDMHFICTPLWTKFYSCEKWVLQGDNRHAQHASGGTAMAGCSTDEVWCGPAD